MTIDVTEALVALCLWPCISYTLGSALAFVVRHWAKWLRPVPTPVLGVLANVAGAALSVLAVVLA